MAKVTITFEDFDDADGPGVKIKAESIPPFGKPGSALEASETEAQSMSKQLLGILAQMNQPEHIHDENCHHEHDHDTGTSEINPPTTNPEG